MFEKRKNSDKRAGISLGLAILLMLGGLFAGMNIVDSSQVDDAELVINSLPDNIDLSGEWIGTTTEDYGYEGRYDYRIIIEQSGNNIKGMSYLDMADDPEIYSESPITGFIDGDTAFYTETTTTVLENISLDNWCLADTTVTYQILNGQETLVGTWDLADHEREGCGEISGRVILTRQSD